MPRNSKLNKENVIIRINDLLNNNNARFAKYQRDYCLYNQTANADLKGKIPLPVGYVDDIYSEDSVVPKLNVIKSTIDTVVSLMGTAHCRPFVNTVKGSFKTLQICNQLQIFFDYYFEENDIQAKVIEALRDACIFDSGYIYINEVDGTINQVSPWNVYTRQTEKGEFHSAYVEFPNCSVDAMNDVDYSMLKQEEIKTLYATIGYFYDSRTHTKATLVNRQIRKIEETAFDIVPVIPIYYTKPIVGTHCLSIADMLKGIQMEIDNLMKRISDASVLNPALTYFISNATNIKVGQLNNKVGNIVQYSSEQGSAPVEVSTPNFIGQQYMTLLSDLVEKAYNMVGVSQNSAQGKKTTGLNSGVALATQQDIESNRFQVLLDQYISMFTQISKTMIKIFKADKNIVSPNKYSLRLTWGDVSKEWDKMKIQFSTADAISRDPSEKLKTLKMLAESGIIPQSQIASLLEIPDINRGWSAATNAYNAVMALIENCIYEDKYETPVFVPYQMLKEQLVNTMLSLYAASTNGSNDEDIDKLYKYYNIVENKEKTMDLPVQQDAVAINTDKLIAGNEGTLGTADQEKANPYSTDVANENELGSEN